jgi:hypothetical protein
MRRGKRDNLAYTNFMLKPVIISTRFPKKSRPLIQKYILEQRMCLITTMGKILKSVSYEIH